MDALMQNRVLLVPQRKPITDRDKLVLVIALAHIVFSERMPFDELNPVDLPYDIRL